MPIQPHTPTRAGSRTPTHPQTRRPARRRIAPDNSASNNTAPDSFAPYNCAPHNTAPDNTAPDNSAPDNTAPGNTAPDRATPSRPVDAGFTLVELLVYISLFGVVLIIVGGMFINSIKTEKDVRSASAATTAGQLVSQSVQAGVRNATAVQVTPDSDGEILRAHAMISGATVGYQCMAWYFSEADGAVYTTSTSPASPITVPGAGPKGSWTLLSDGVERVGADPVFTLATAADTPDAVELRFAVEAGDRAPVLIHTTAYTRTTTPESAPCF